MSGRVVHFEMPYDDQERAQRFYQDVFGWQVQPMPEMDYTIVMTGPTEEQSGPTEPGFINGGMFARGGDSPVRAPNVVIDVASIDDALREVQAAGGSLVSERMPVGEMGFAAYFSDPEGNLVGLWETRQS